MFDRRDEDIFQRWFDNVHLSHFDACCSKSSGNLLLSLSDPFGYDVEHGSIKANFVESVPFLQDLERPIELIAVDFENLAPHLPALDAIRRALRHQFAV